MKKVFVTLATVIITACLLVAMFSSRASASGTGYQAGDIIVFGSYPQTQVTDTALISTLDKQSKTWKNYPYFSGSTKSDASNYPAMLNESLMKYADFTYSGVKYRAVYINEYLSIRTGRPAGESSVQSYKFEKNTTYYFVWEPIEWIVLNASTGLVISSKILDSQPYCCYYNENGIQGSHNTLDENACMANFCLSTIRAWLNKYTVSYRENGYEWYENFNFLTAAFTTDEQEIILTTQIENVDYSERPSMDRLFLLSLEEYNQYKDNISLGKDTGYAFSQGRYGLGWFLRTPMGDSESGMRESGRALYYVSTVQGGNASYADTNWREASSTMTGTRPAMRLDLSSSLVQPLTDTFTVTPICTGEYPVLSWSGHGLTGIQSWKVLRCPNNKSTDVASNWSTLTTLSSANERYTDKTAARETTYSYKVIANGASKTYESNIVSGYGRLPAPVVSWTNNSEGKPVLSWGGTGASKYQVYTALRSTYTLIGSTSNLSYVVSNAQTATTSTYIVVSVSSVDRKYNSVISRNNRVSVPCKLATPTNVECFMDGTKPTIRWTAVDGAESYQIYGRTTSSSWILDTASGTSVTDAGAPRFESVSYRVVACTSAGEDYTSDYVWTSTVWSNVAPVITEQPADITVAVGNTAKFSVKATGTGTLTYQWQYRKNASSEWKPSGQSGNKTATLSVATTVGLHGYQFRCIVMDSTGQTISNAVTLKLRPRITTQPADTTAAVGNKATFTVEATGKSTLTYQWQYRKNETDEWKTSGQSGNKTATLSVATTAGLHGYQFRCRITDGNNQKSYTKTVTLSVRPKITTWPKDTEATVGSTAQFTVAATGKTPLKYQWQYRRNSTDTWKKSGQSGNSTATLSVAVTAGLHGYQFRCYVTDANGQKSYTNTVTLTVKPAITTQPSNKSVTAGTAAKFTVVADGKAKLTYQWQYRKNSSDTWKPSGQSGNKTATLSVAATKGLNGYQFRCVVTDGNGQKSYTNTVTLTVN